MALDGKDPIYSSKYQDDEYEYRHIFLTKQMLSKLPKDKLLLEDEWRALGIQQSHGWEHYMVHAPEPHILLFRRELDYLVKFGNQPRPAGTSTLLRNKENAAKAMVQA